MLARVTIIEGMPDRIDASIRNYKEQVLPVAEGLAGFKGAYFLVDRKNGKQISITIWDSEQAERASAAAADRLREQAVKAAGIAKPQLVETFEIAVQPEPVAA